MSLMGQGARDPATDENPGLVLIWVLFHQPLACTFMWSWSGGRASTHTPFLLERQADKVDKLLVDSVLMENGSFKLILRGYGRSTVCGEMYLSESS